MHHDLTDAVEALGRFLGDLPLNVRIARLEERLTSVRGAAELSSTLAEENVDDSVLRGALVIKELAGQIHVVVHALGILLALPFILGEDERVVSVSLGAGTGGRRHDLVTNRRIGEFKFIRWRGHDAVRQSSLFADFVALAIASTDKRRCLYVTGAARPRAFLQSSRRAISSVCARRPDILERLIKDHGDRFTVVLDYYSAFAGLVEIIDLEAILPAYRLQEIQAIDPE